jgi:hypothetical protein
VFYVLSALVLLYYARKICNTIEAWYSLGASSSNNDRADGVARPTALTKDGQTALAHSRRLYWTAWVLCVTYLVRAVSWSAQSVDPALYDDAASPWYYPFCFYQIPQLNTTVAVMCLVGNADNRARALGAWCLVELGVLRCRRDRSEVELAAVRESLVSPLSGCFRLSSYTEDAAIAPGDDRRRTTGEVEIDMASIFSTKRQGQVEVRTFPVITQETSSV